MASCCALNTLDDTPDEGSQDVDIGEVVAAICPDGVFKFDASKLKEFATRVNAGPEGQESCSVAGRMALVLDYDLTVSAGDATECHHIIQTSPEVPQDLREQLASFWDALSDPSTEHPIVKEISADDPHRFWLCFNRIVSDYGLTENTIKRAVAAEKVQRGNIIRPGIQELFDLCELHKIPVVLLSAGISQIIHEAFRQDAIRVPSVCHIFANTIIFDSDGRCTDVEPKHPPSSRVGKLHQLSHVPDIVERPCIILAGDKPVDASVGKGLPPLSSGKDHTLLKFGFFHAALRGTPDLSEYIEVYDILPKDGIACTWEPFVAMLKTFLATDAGAHTCPSLACDGSHLHVP